MAAFQRLPHHIDVADAFERVIGAALRKVDEIRHQIAFDFFRIDEMCHTKLLRERLAPCIQIDAHDHIGAGYTGTLYYVQADPAKSEYDDIRAGFDLRGVDHGTNAGRHTAADVADFVERSVFSDFGKRDLRHHCVV